MNIIPGNLAYLSFTAFVKRYLIIAIYGPNRDATEFYENHAFNITNFPIHDYVLWAGDWNLVLDQKKDTKKYKGEYNKKVRRKVIENIVANNLVDVWRAKYPNKKEFTWHKAVKNNNPIAQRAGLDFILTDDDLASHIKDCGIELPDKISDHSGTWIEFDTENFCRGPGLWRFNNSFLDEPEFKDIVSNTIKTQTKIHAKINMTNEDWDKLSIEDYQFIDLADDVDQRIFYDCLLPAIRGECIKYGANKKRLKNQEKENLERKVSSINRLINLKENPTPETLDKLETLMQLKAALDEKNSEESVRNHRAKLLLEGEHPTKYFCSLQKIVEKTLV